jgi:membrane-associated protease RseP (regulator of RpoE activity)
VREEYERHVKGSIKDFGTFYEAQLAWEETMAETLVQALKALPETTRVVVLIGNGHIWEGRGVPRNARRRLDHRYRTIIPLPADYSLRRLEQGSADYIWITPVPPEGHRPRLGITIQALPDGEGIAISEVAGGGRAEKAGFQKGDVIKNVNGAPVRTLEDLHRSLSGQNSFKRFGIRRNGREMEIPVEWKMKKP